jgi:hypothetical protein
MQEARQDTGTRAGPQAHGKAPRSGKHRVFNKNADRGGQACMQLVQRPPALQASFRRMGEPNATRSCFHVHTLSSEYDSSLEAACNTGAGALHRRIRATCSEVLSWPACTATNAN